MCSSAYPTLRFSDTFGLVSGLMFCAILLIVASCFWVTFSALSETMATYSGKLCFEKAYAPNYHGHLGFIVSERQCDERYLNFNDVALLEHCRRCFRKSTGN